MSKAILVFDMPNSCRECPCCICTEFDTYCGRTDMQLEYDFEQCAYVKPDWCPLRPVPEKHKELSIEEYEFGKLGLAFTQGFNSCIDEILGENNNEKFTY